MVKSGLDSDFCCSDAPSVNCSQDVTVGYTGSTKKNSLNLTRKITNLSFQPSWQIADPIISLAGACVILISTFFVLRDSINILLEGKQQQFEQTLLYFGILLLVHDTCN